MSLAFSTTPTQAVLTQTSSTDRGSGVEDSVEHMELLEHLKHHGVRRRLRSPITWFGGKGVLARKIVSLFPAHHCYVEPFCGGASCLFAKPPSPVEVINDLNSDIVNFFRVLRDPQRFEQFYGLASLTPYSREEFYRFRTDWRAGWSQCPSDVVRAYRWYMMARMSFSGEFGGSWGYSVTTSRRGMANAVSQWLSILDMLPAISERMRRVQVEHGDWRTMLHRYDTPDTLFYVDPPYVKSTRRSGKYAHEMDDDAHQELVEMLRCIKGGVLLSGYRNPTYAQLEDEGWERLDMPTVCYAAGRTRYTRLLGKGAIAYQRRTESIWVSPRARNSRNSKRNEGGAAYVQGVLNFGV